MEFINNWYKTAKAVIFHPKEFFKSMPTTGGFGEPFKFAVINIFIASLLGAAFLHLIMSSLSWDTDRSLVVICIVYMDLGAAFLMSALISIFSESYLTYDIIWFAIVLILGNIFILPAIYHLFLRLLGAKKNYEATFRIKAYLSVFYLLSCIPLINIFALLYFFYVTAIAFKEVHEISMKRAIVPVVLIIIILSAILFGSYLWIMGLQEAMQAKAIAGLLK